MTPLLDHHPRLLEAVRDLAALQLVSAFPVATLVLAVLQAAVGSRNRFKPPADSSQLRTSFEVISGSLERACSGRASTAIAAARTISAWCIGRYLDRQGLLKPHAESSYLTGGELEAGSIEQLLGPSITYRIAVGPRRGRKMLTADVAGER